MTKILTFTVSSLLIVAAVFLLGYLLPITLPVVFFWWLRRYVQPPDPYQCTYPDGADLSPSDAWAERICKWIEER